MQGIDEDAPVVSTVVSAWQTVTIESITQETKRARTLRLSIPDRRAFRPGQHVDVRLTAPDGYQAQRSYSIASAPELDDGIDLTVELVDDGEVSPWFHEVAQVGDTFELRGPIGGPFTWTHIDGGPLLLLAGGSGIVPLMSMLRHRRAQRASPAALLLYSSRTIDGAIYREELETLSAEPGGPLVLLTLTRERPQGWTGLARRIDRGMLEEALPAIGIPRWVFICGPTAFVGHVATEVLAAGVSAESIRTERFGPSG
jgi:ferredoxin-NADP reductase